MVYNMGDANTHIQPAFFIAAQLNILGSEPRFSSKLSACEIGVFEKAMCWAGVLNFKSHKEDAMSKIQKFYNRCVWGIVRYWLRKI